MGTIIEKEAPRYLEATTGGWQGAYARSSMVLCTSVGFGAASATVTMGGNLGCGMSCTGLTGGVSTIYDKGGGKERTNGIN